MSVSGLAGGVEGAHHWFLVGWGRGRAQIWHEVGGSSPSSPRSGQGLDEAAIEEPDGEVERREEIKRRKETPMHILLHDRRPPSVGDGGILVHFFFVSSTF